MTSAPVVTKASTSADGGLRRVLVVLCVTEITSWGILYYAFTVLSASITRHTGWSQSAVTAAFSAGLVTSALIGGSRWVAGSTGTVRGQS